MYSIARSLLLLHLPLAACLAADQPVTIRFQAVVSARPLVCGQKYESIGTSKSTIAPRDFRFYVSNVRLVSDTGQETPLQLEQDGKWQLDDLTLLDFENGSASCQNGTPDLNTTVRGSVPPGRYRGLRFTLGVPFARNHLDITTQPPPLNLTALAWVWNAGHKFARLDYSSTGNPRGVAIHLGSTGCKPSETRITIPTTCSEPNRVEVEFAVFDPEQDVVTADLAALLQDADPDQPKAGCMSAPGDAACAPLFAAFGLPFDGKPAAQQRFFRKESANVPAAANAEPPAGRQR
jgi:uncharacterized repeat protein (TIGR04052 family)